MKVAVSALGWLPRDFWAATLTELFDAFEAMAEAREAAGGGGATPTRTDLEALMKDYG